MFPWLADSPNEGEARFSPDGRWVSYISDQTGSAEVWVRPFHGPGSPVRVSPNGGRDPVWSRDGRELFYQEGNKLMTAEVASAQAGLQLSTPRMLFEGGFIAWESNTPRTYDVAPDGRFLMIEPTPSYLTQLCRGSQLDRRVETARAVELIRSLNSLARAGRAR